MQIIFLQNVKGTAQIGDIKKVSDGYGKYLLINGIAKKVDSGALHQAVFLSKKKELERTKKETWAREVMEKIKDITITVHADANTEGHLYGSVDSKMIVEEANKFGLNLEPGDVVLPHGLKNIGSHEVQIELTDDLKTILKVVVEAKK